MTLADLIASIEKGDATACVADGISFVPPRVVNHGSGDLGDALLGLCAVAGIRGRVVYKVRATHLPYLELFDLGDTSCGPHEWDGTRGM